MMKLIFTGFIILVAVNSLMAQTTFTVSLGTTKEYHIDAQPSITTYNWQVYDDSNLSSLTGSSDVTLTSLGAGRENEIQVTWNTLGTYYLYVDVVGSDGCTNKAAWKFNVVVNNLPVLADDSNSTTETIAINESDGSGNLLANDTDPDGDILTITSIDSDVSGTVSGTYGLLSWNTDGTYTYTPNSELDTLYLGETVIETFTVAVGDGISGNSTSTLTITINGINAAPVASNDTNSTTETGVVTNTGTNSSGLLLGNDTDIDNDTLRVWQVDGTDTGTVEGTYGVLTWNSDGTYTYTPNSELDTLAVGENVNEVFTYSCGDGNGGTDDALLSITINGQNAAPVASNDTNSTTETGVVTSSGTNSSGVLLGNDTDIDNDVLTVWQIDGTDTGSVEGTYGILTWNGDGTYTYTPNSELDSLGTGESVNEIFTYSCGDGNGGSDDATLTITINGLNTLPVLGDDTNLAIETTAVDETDGSGNLLANDSDADGNVLTIDSINGDASGTVVGTYGTLNWNSDGSYTYSPNAEMDSLANGETVNETFIYFVNDGNGGVVAANLVITISGVNQAPIAVDDNNTTDESTTVSEVNGSGNLLANDTDIDGDVLAVSLMNGSSSTTVSGTYGTIRWYADGTYTYIPNAALDSLDEGEQVVEVFTVTINDGNGGTSTSTLSIVINGIINNLPPVAEADYVSVDEDTPITINVLNNDIDPDNDPLTYSIVQNPLHGSLLSINTDGIVYAPDEDYNGSDFFIYQVCDNGDPRLCDNDTVFITVNPVNDAPVAFSDENSVEMGSSVNETAGSGSLLLNDTDVDGDVLVVTEINGSVNDTITGTYGVLIWNTDGSYVYTPFEVDMAQGEIFTETFTYSISDGNGESASSTLTIEIRPNNRQIVVDASTYCLADAPYLDYDVTLLNFNDTTGYRVDITWYDSNNQVVLTLADQPLTGTLLWPGAEIDENGNGVDWPGWIFADNRWVEGNDGFQDTRTGSVVKFKVNPESTVEASYPPATPDCAAGPAIELADDFETINSGESLTVDILSNDSGVSLGYDISVIDGPNSGNAVLNSDGTLTYNSDSNFAGTDTITYVVSNSGGSDTALVVITVNEVVELTTNTYCEGNMPFYAWSIEASGIDVTSIDLNIYNSNNELVETFTGVDPSGSREWPGTTAVSNNALYDVPAVLQTINIELEVVINNQNGITLKSSLNAPDCHTNTVIAMWDTITVLGEETVIDVLANDFDPDEGDIDTSSVHIVTSPDFIGPYHGIVAVNPDGTISYTPDNGYAGVDSFMYQVCDDYIDPACDTAIVRLNVLFNDKLVANNDHYTVYQNLSNTFNISANDFDPEGMLDLASIVIITNPENGSLIVNGDGTVTYQSTTTFEGTDQFQYVICDKGIPKECDTAWVYVDVHQNQCISATWDDTITYVNNPVIIEVLNNDFDAEQELDSTTLQIESLQNFNGPYHGEAVVNGDGTITYIPDQLFVGVDSFIYSICDNGYPTCCDTAVVRINVIDDNIGVVANRDDVSTPDYKSITIDVLSNDYDPDGVIDSSSLRIVNPPAQGNAQVDLINGVITYQPDQGYSGLDSIIYQICDNGPVVACDTAIVYIKVAENLPPVAVNDTINAFWGQNQPHVISTNDYDPENMLDAASVSIVAQPVSGGVSVDETTGTIYYMPDYCADAIDSFTYVIYDRQGNVSNIATVIVNISIDPEADYDMDGVPDIAEDVVIVDGNPCNDDTDGDGIFNFQDPDDDGDGILTINEDLNFNGDPTDDDFDGDGIANYLDNNDENDCALTIDEDLNHDGDPTNDDLDNDGIPNYLDLDDNGDGIPSCDQMEDLNGDSIPDYEQPWVPGVNNDVVFVGFEESSTHNIQDFIVNDSTQMDSLSFDVINDPVNGVLDIDQNNWTITYTPNLNFVGVDSFQYVLCDYYGIVCDTATVVIHVEDIIDVPQIFTPNDDGQNDRLIITGLNRYSYNKFTVFNRWGNKVYEKLNYNGEWDGRANTSFVVGKDQLPVGTYYYIIEYGPLPRKKPGELFLKR